MLARDTSQATMLVESNLASWKSRNSLIIVDHSLDTSGNTQTDLGILQERLINWGFFWDQNAGLLL
jgi:hypothetical protein